MKLPDFNTVHEVNRYRPLEILVLDLSLEYLDVNCAIGLSEVLLEESVCNLSLFLIFIIPCFWNNSTMMYLFFENLINAAEELKYVLAVERISGGNIIAQGVLSVRNEVDLYVLAEMHVSHSLCAFE